MECINEATNQVAQVFRDALRHRMRRHLRTLIDHFYRPDLVIIVENHELLHNHLLASQTK